MRFDYSDDSAERTDSARPGEPAPQRVIVKVRRSGYVPHGFTVRAKIDDTLYTAEAAEPDVAAARDDPQVESVERARRLHPER
jgi:hypothetical protein